MSDVKQKRAALTLKGKTYELSLTLNLIEAFQERYGDMTAVFEKSQNMGELKWILCAALNEAAEIHNDDHPEDIWPKLTEAQVGRMINRNNMAEMNAALMEMFQLSVPQSESDEEDDEKN